MKNFLPALLVLALLAGCGTLKTSVPLYAATPPGPAATASPIAPPTATPAPSAIPLPGATPTSLPTATPLPSLTPTEEPSGSLQDVGSWPASLQAYYNRAPQEWEQPSQGYLADAEFDRRLAQMRRDLLSQAGVDAAALDGPALLLAYQRWAYQNAQVMIFSPSEIAAIRNGPFRIAYTDYAHVSPLLSPGISFRSAFQADPGQEATIEFMRNTGLFNSLPVFGHTVQRPPNDGLVGLLTGVVRVPGVDPAVEVLLYVTYRAQGVIYSDLVSVPLQTVEHAPGDLILDDTGALAALQQSFSLPPAINGLCSWGLAGCSSAPRLKVRDLLQALGSACIINAYYAHPGDMAGLNTIGEFSPQHIERAYVVAPGMGPLVDMSLPWD